MEAQGFNACQLENTTYHLFIIKRQIKKGQGSINLDYNKTK